MFCKRIQNKKIAAKEVNHLLPVVFSEEEEAQTYAL